MNNDDVLFIECECTIFHIKNLSEELIILFICYQIINFLFESNLIFHITLIFKKTTTHLQFFSFTNKNVGDFINEKLYSIQSFLIKYLVLYIGIICGSIFAVLLITGIIVFVVTRSKRKKSKSAHSDGYPILSSSKGDTQIEIVGNDFDEYVNEESDQWI